MKLLNTQLHTSPPRSTYNLGWLLASAAFLMVAMALRVYHLDAKNLWVDEAHPWWYASLPLLSSVGSGLSGGPINSGADPLYNVLLHYWILLSGNTLFGLRFLSVLLNILGVAYLGRIAGRLSGPKSLLLGLGVGTLAPIWVFYSQELRPYAFIPMIMAVMLDSVLEIQRSNGRKLWAWIMFVVSQCWALYTHGFMVVAVFVVNCWVFLLAARRWGSPEFRLWLQRWIRSEGAVMLLYAPMIPLFLARVGGIRNPFAEPLTAPQFATEMWNYSLGIAWENVFDPLAERVLIALILLLFLGTLTFSLRGSRKRVLADSIWLTLLIGGLCLLYDWRDPSFHPRYAIFMTVPLFIMLVLAISSSFSFRFPEVLLGSLLAISIVVASAVNLSNLYAGRYSGYRHPSTKQVSDVLKQDFGPDDGIVVIAPHDFTLNYYGSGPASLAWARFDEGVDSLTDVLNFVANKRTIGVLRNTNERSDSRRVLRFYLERYGTLVHQQFFQGYDIATYQLDQNVKPKLVRFDPLNIDWTQLRLKGVSTDSGDSVTVALAWQATSLIAKADRLSSSIRLVDPLTGIVLASADGLILSDHGEPTDLWLPNTTTTQYFTLPLAPGTPMIEANIEVTLYDSITGASIDMRDIAGAPAGQQLDIGRIKLSQSKDEWAYSDDLLPWKLIASDPGTELAGYALDRETIVPGGNIGVILKWVIPPDDLKQIHPIIEIVQGNTVVATDKGLPLAGRMPASSKHGWIDLRRLNISNSLKPGPVELVIKTDKGKLITSTLQVSAFERNFDMPDVANSSQVDFINGVKLLGYDIDSPDPLTSTGVVNLTLYWQAIQDGNINANYKVFAQMLAEDGHLVGQHDGIPALETRPFSGWLTGEFVTDIHPMLFNGPYSGKIHIQVGLYDPVTLQRVLTADGKDAVILPVELMVDPEP